MSTALALVAFVLMAAFFAGSETGAYRLNRVRLRHQAQTGSLSARMLQRLTGNMERFVCLTLVGTNVAVYGATAVFTTALAGAFKAEGMAELVSTMILSPVLLVCCDLLPKSIFHVMPNRMMRWAAGLLFIVDRLCWPVTVLLYWAVKFLRRWLGGAAATHQIVVSAHHLDFFLTESRQEGVITPQQDRLVRNILRLDDRHVGGIMVPLERIVMVEENAERDEVLDAIRHYDHPRLPVYSGDRRNVTGVLRPLDYVSSIQSPSVKQVMSRPVRLKPGDSLGRAFRALQSAGQSLGVVADDDNLALGIITMPGLLKEMFSSLGSR